MHNEISPPGLITKSKCVRQKGEHFKHGGKIVYLCNHTLNMSGILIVNYYPNIETHTQSHKHTRVATLAGLEYSFFIVVLAGMAGKLLPISLAITNLTLK